MADVLRYIGVGKLVCSVMKSLSLNYVYIFFVKCLALEKILTNFAL